MRLDCRQITFRCAWLAGWEPQAEPEGQKTADGSSRRPRDSLECPPEQVAIPIPHSADTMSAEAIVSLHGLTVRYGSFVAVAGLDLELPRGELFGLLGPNGAGKSTTLRVLIGQRPAQRRVGAGRRP